MRDFLEACRNTQQRDGYFQQQADLLVKHAVPLPIWPDEVRAWALAEIEANLLNLPPYGPENDDLAR